MATTNEDQIEFWNNTLGDVWVRRAEVLNRPAAPLGRAVMDALELAPGMDVLDVGCGTGHTTREIAERVAPGGSVTGVDVSRPMLEHAREVSSHLDNVVFQEADAQTADLGSGAFDRAFSRMGVMFFADPVAAFANIRQAVRPDGRLGFVCWQDALLNPWMALPVMAAIPICGMPELPEPHEPGPFSLAEADRIREVLAGAGWQQVNVEAMETEFVLPLPLSEAVDVMFEIGPLRRMTEDADPETLGKVREALLEAMADHQTDRGVGAAAATWLVTARR